MANTDWTMDGMNDPLLLQRKILNRFEEETGTVIVDPNNTPSLLMEAFASTTAGLVRKLEDTVRPAIYPARAKDAEDLYKHLSDYEYINIFASPASTTLLMTLDRAYVMANARQFTDADGVTYYKIIIPKTTIFTIGDHKFGLYYPIEIRCNISTNRLYIVYDLSQPNPMHTMASNVLEYDVREVEGRDIIYLKVPVYQFKVDVFTDSAVVGSGYKRVVSYTDKFYAIRVKANVLQNPGHDDTQQDEWAMQEIKLSVSGMTYDTDQVTMVFTPDPDAHIVTLEIPYIYFSRGLIAGNVEVEIYTTEGEINYTLPSIEEQEQLELCSIDMFGRLGTDKELISYVNPFRRMPALAVVPLSAAVVGGNNGMSLETLRKRVVNGTLQTKTLQTPADIDAYFETLGYKSTILRDGVTDRIYLVHSSVQNVENEIVSAGTLNTIFDFRLGNIKNYSTVVGSDNGHVFTILPSTIYKFDPDKNVCLPLTDRERIAMDALTRAKLAEEYNSETYTLSPFHLQVDTSARYPTSITYDMQDTEIAARTFIGDRDSNEYQLILNSVSMAVQQSERNPLTDKYVFTFNVSSSGLESVEPVVSQDDGSIVKNFRVFCGLKDIDGVYHFTEAEFVYKEDNANYFQVSIYSDYKFHQFDNEHSVELTTYGNVAGSETSKYFLTSEMRVMLTINGNIGNIKDPDGDGIITTARNIVTDYSNALLLASPEEYYALTEYKLVCKFGSVVDELDQRINLTYSEMQYLRYGYTKFKTLSLPMYKLDSHNELVLENDESGYPHPVLLHTMGRMECMTDTIEETMTLNSETIRNYIGCTVVDVVNNAGTSDLANNWVGKPISSDPDTYRAGINSTFTIKDAPVVPRFLVTDADDVEGTSTIATGTYELVDAIDKPGLATPDDLWVKAVAGKKLSEEQPNWLNKFYVQDALEYIKSVCTSKSVSQLEAYTPSKGEFILETGIKGAFDELVPEIGILHDTSDWCRVLYCYDPDKPCAVLAKMQSADTWDSLIYDKVRNPVAGWVSTREEQRPNAETGEMEIIESEMMYHNGWVYHAEMCEADSLIGGKLNQQFVHFFRTKTLDDGSVIPDISPVGYVIASGPKNEFEKHDHDPVTHETIDTDATKDDLGKVYKFIEYTQNTGAGGEWVHTERLVKGVMTVDAEEEEDRRYGWENFVPESNAQTVCWKDHCEKYPWDCTTWWNIDIPTTINAETGVRVPDGSKPITMDIDKRFTINLDEARMYRYLVHSGKQYDFDDNGNLQEDPNGDSRHIEYMLSMLQIDAKHVKIAPLSMLLQKLRAHFDNIGRARNEMFTNTRLFFSAFQSIGYAPFKTGPDKTENMSLDVSVKLRLHVNSGTASDETTRNAIRDQIIRIIDARLQAGYLNLNEVANLVVTTLAGSVLMVDVLGINGRPDVQTLRSLDDEVRPHLKHSLQVLDDGVSLDLTRGLELEFVVDE